MTLTTEQVEEIKKRMENYEGKIALRLEERDALCAEVLALRKVVEAATKAAFRLHAVVSAYPNDKCADLIREISDDLMREVTAKDTTKVSEEETCTRSVLMPKDEPKNPEEGLCAKPLRLPTREEILIFERDTKNMDDDFHSCDCDYCELEERKRFSFAATVALDLKHSESVCFEKVQNLTNAK